MENTFLDRLKIEKEELSEKVTKLDNFLSRLEKLGNTLSEANYLLLKEQLEVMNRYLGILIIRIELLEK
jgi:hypothetical protein